MKHRNIFLFAIDIKKKNYRPDPNLTVWKLRSFSSLSFPKHFNSFFTTALKGIFLNWDVAAKLNVHRWHHLLCVSESM